MSTQKDVVNQEAPSLSPEDALKYLANVANTYASRLDNVAKEPFVGYVNACLSVVAGDRVQASRMVSGLRQQNEMLQADLAQADKEVARMRRLLSEPAASSDEKAGADDGGPELTPRLPDHIAA